MPKQLPILLLTILFIGSASAQSLRYPNGQRMYSSGSGSIYYENGQRALSGSSKSIYHPNGNRAYSRSSGSVYYENGSRAYSGSSGSIYYPNGQRAYSGSSGSIYYENGQRFGKLRDLTNPFVIKGNGIVIRLMPNGKVRYKLRQRNSCYVYKTDFKNYFQVVKDGWTVKEVRL